jgi:hypothetical protein
MVPVAIASVLHGLSAAGRWLKANIVWVFLMLLGAFTGAKLLKRKDSQVASLKEALAVERVKKDVALLRARREDILAQDAAYEVNEQALAQKAIILTAEIRDKQRKALAIHNKQLDIYNMSDVELEEHFKNAGL